MGKEIMLSRRDMLALIGGTLLLGITGAGLGNNVLTEIQKNKNWPFDPSQQATQVPESSATPIPSATPLPSPTPPDTLSIPEAYTQIMGTPDCPCAMVLLGTMGISALALFLKKRQ